MSSAIHSQRNIFIVRICLSLAFLEGIAVFWSYLSASSEAESVVFLQYSLLRLILLLVVFLFLLVILYFLAASYKPHWRTRIFADDLWIRKETFWVWLLMGGLTYYLLFASDQKLDSLASYRERLYPLLVWFGLIILQLIITFLLVKGSNSGILPTYRDTLIPSGIALLLLVLLIAFIALTRVGLTPDLIYWQGPGVPLMFAQVLVASTVALAFNSLVHRFRNKADLVACIALWVLAVFLWSGQPARASYNILEPAPPNFQEYPFGDAILYDTAAHEFLTGTALPNDFWVKPMYSFFLAFLHLFAGENYAMLVLLQIAILAIVPVLVYLLVNLIGNRSAGVLASLLVILREQNSIALSNVIQVSHLKLLLSDVFSMGLVVLLLWLMFRWFKKPEEHRDSPLLIGGVLGLLTLTRGHPLLLFPIILLVIYSFKAAGSRLRLQRVALFVAGLTLVLLPWLWRIYETTGRVALQSPVSPYSANMAGLYSLTPRLASPEEFSTEVSQQTLEQSDLQNRQIRDFVLQHPGEVIRFSSAHFFHNVIYSYIYLPQSFRIEGLRQYVTAEPFWGNWQGELSSQNWILLFINMGLIALGLGATWRRHNLLSVVPLAVSVGYIASVSIGRISGWRFILPADWITLVYFSIGLVQLSYLVSFLGHRSVQDVSIQNEIAAIEKPQTSWVRTAGFALAFLSIGTTVTYGNHLFSNRLPIRSDEEVTGFYLRAPEPLFNENELNAFLQSDGAMVAYGQAIYPYFLKANSGPVNHFWPAYKPRPYGRLVFYLVGHESMNVILPVSSSDFNFPDGAEVIVLGCANERGDVEALSVLLVGVPSFSLMREPMPELACPFPEPK